MKRSRVLTIAAVAAGILLGSFALEGYAQGKGGGGGLSGTIYFRLSDQTWTMNPDGSNKRVLMPVIGHNPSPFTSSGGKRWFFGWVTVQENYWPDPTYSWGNRFELVAMREDGYTVQLTDNPVVQLGPENTGPTWVYDSSRGLPGGVVSWIGRTWDMTPGAESVVTGGIYTARVLFDANGDVLGLETQPTMPTLERPLVPGANDSPVADVSSHDFDPTGARIAFRRYGASEILVANLGTGSLQFLTTGGGPIWSPAGSLIAFTEDRSLLTIAPDGSGRKVIVKRTARTSISSPTWSNTGSHILYVWFDQLTWDMHIYRATSAGGSKTLLTSDLNPQTFKGPLGWR